MISPGGVLAWSIDALKMGEDLKKEESLSTLDRSGGQRKRSDWHRVAAEHRNSVITLGGVVERDFPGASAGFADGLADVATDGVEVFGLSSSKKLRKGGITLEHPMFENLQGGRGKV